MQELFRRRPKFSNENDNADGPVIPDGLWIKCPKCKELAYSRDFERRHRVCPRCDYHVRLTARERIEALVDADSFIEWDSEIHTADPLGFVANNESYKDKASQAARKSGSNEALITGQAMIESQPVVITVTEFAFLGASMGSVYGEKFVRAVERAIEARLPLVSVSTSGGARMHESALSLMQMAKTTSALARLGQNRLPHVAILADPCYGGVTASYTTVADVIIAEPGAMIGFAGPRVIEQITKQKLPDGFQTAEFLLEHGMIDLIAHRTDMRARLNAILTHFHCVQPCAECMEFALRIAQAGATHGD